MDEVEIECVWNDRQTGQIVEVELVVTREGGSQDHYSVLTEPASAARGGEGRDE